MTRWRLMAIVALTALLGLGAAAAVGVALQPSGHGAPTGTGLPGGGISRERAIEIALEGGVLPSDWRIGATARLDSRFDRWVWQVSYAHDGGPTGSEGGVVILDFFSGAILDRHDWIS